MAINARKWATSLGVIALGVWLTSCGDEPLGQLTLSIQSDMKIPDDVDALRLYVFSSDGTERASNRFEIGPGRQGLIPMTIALVPLEDGLNPIRIRLFSDEGDRTRTLREVVLSVPRGKNPHLRMPISWLCSDRLDRSDATKPSEIRSDCDDGETCVMGQCVTEEVDASELEEFRLQDVYGGGTDGASGTCLDTLGCFARPQGEKVDLDMTDCSIAAPSETGDGINVAMVRPLGTEGICGQDNCLIPLDEDPGRFPYFVGWQREGQRILLPPEVCRRVDIEDADRRILGVALTTACKTKTPSIPTCGPWSAVTSDSGTENAPGPAGDFGQAPSACGDLVAQAGEAALCVQLSPEELDPEPGDETLDGVGDLVVELFDGPDAGSAMLLEQVTRNTVNIRDEQARFVPFEGLGVDEVFVRATFYDNPDETTLREIRLGGAWRGAPDPEDTDTPLGLQRVAITAGEVSDTLLPMQAVRRLAVTLRLAGGASPSDGGDGPASWRAYAVPNPGPDDIPTGFSEVQCKNLSGGAEVIRGHVIGADPHYLVASVDDYNVAVADFPAPGSLPGSLWSGIPGAGDTWNASAAELQLGASTYRATATLDLGYTVDPGDMPPATYECPEGGSCSDGELNGGETDVDCGGSCLKCAAGKACAGDGDCEQLVCTDRVCDEATCSDGVTNGVETDADCGGGLCDPCELDQLCLSGNDCVSGRCITNRCQPAA